MAGVKGRSGGARPNTGGARPGAGRKPKPVEPLSVDVTDDTTPLAFLLSVQNDAGADPQLRVRAAIAAAQYMHLKKGDGGIKDERADKAKQAASGKFGAAAPPKLVVNNR